MDEEELIIKLILDELDVPAFFHDKTDRIAIQKAIYLAQYSGLELGLTYNWYVNGPYCPLLTPKYYSIRSSIIERTDKSRYYTLADEDLKILERPKELSKVPEGVNLKRYEWLELIASILFLKKRNFSEESINQRINTEKPHLIGYYNNAVDELIKFNYI